MALETLNLVVLYFCDTKQYYGLVGYTDMKEEFKDDINLVFGACN